MNIPITMGKTGATTPDEEAWLRLEARLNAAKTRFQIARDACPQARRIAKSFEQSRINLRASLPALNVSNAWVKAWELFSQAWPRLPPPAAAPLRHFDNASLPGAWLLAGAHMAASARQPYSWRASSLYASEEKGALQDDFGLMRLYPENWVKPTADYDGDVTKPETFDHLAKTVGRTIHLYTSDLGFAPRGDPNRHEEEHHAANVGQVRVGLRLLQPGGTLITKQFTFFRRESRLLIASLVGQFRKVSICKPFFSKPANSEVYLVCTGFLGPREPKEVAVDDQLFHAQRLMVEQQCAALKQLADAFDANLPFHIDETQEACEHWRRQYFVPRLYTPPMGSVAQKLFLRPP